jgi:hypothetical protein
LLGVGARSARLQRVARPAFGLKSVQQLVRPGLELAAEVAGMLAGLAADRIEGILLLQYVRSQARASKACSPYHSLGYTPG